jgi:hypothetical protein
MTIRRSRRVGLLALIAFVSALILPLVGPGHGFGDDAGVAFGYPAVGLGHPETQFEIAYTGPAAEHCAVCQWARALGHTVAGGWVYAAPARVTDSTAALQELSSSNSTPAPGPPRGPPSAL